MTRRAFVLVAALALSMSCGSVHSGAEPTVGQEVAPPPPALDSLVTTEWLSEHLGDPDLVVLDCTVVVQRNEDGSVDVVNGRANYEGGHIPSAGFADLLGDLSDTESELQFAVPAPEEFASAMEALGVGDDTRVVLYDATGSPWAARVWWMLRWIGFDQAALLDGGLAAWTAEDRPLSTDPVERPAGTLTVAVRPHLIADRDEVLAAINDPGVHIVDVLPEPHYRGEMAMYARAGHIPGAANIPVVGLTDETGHYRSLDELAAMHPTDHGARYITYCGGGIAASSSAFVMTRLGYTDVAVYTASLQEWAADPELPMETVPGP
ncbi:MAG TPA: sulfurtransferase [Candidatus Sulfomarinibacteraceae bacterium]|nr:sulfurtransferase [Candidatus Sulfomarinibacteraceae bacterium]